MKNLFLLFITYSILIPPCAAELKEQLYPVDFQNGHYSIVSDIPGVLELDLTGNYNNFRNKEIWMEFSLPPELILLESRYKRGDLVKFPKAKIIKTSKGEYRFKLPERMIKSLKQNSYAWYNAQQIVLSVSKDAKLGKYPVTYKLFSNRKIYCKGSFTVEILPALSTRRKIPKYFQLHGGRTSVVNFGKETTQSYYRYLRSLNAKPKLWHQVISRNTECFKSEYSPTLMIFLGTSMPILHCGWQKNKRITSKMQFIESRDKSDKLRNAALIPEVQYVIDDPDGLIWDKLVPDYIRSQSKSIGLSFKEICLNFEPGPIYSAYGMSMKNRTEFAEYAKLNKVPDSGEIKLKYVRQWFEFRLNQNNLIAKRFLDCIHKYFPGTKAIICTAVLYPHVRSGCAVDPKALDKSADGFANMFYTSAEKMDKQLKDNSKPLLKKEQLVMMDPAERIQKFYSRYTPEFIKQNILAAGAYNYEGVAFWPDMLLDGEYYIKIAEAFDTLAKVENIYRGGRSDKDIKYKIVNTAEQIFNTGGKKLSVSFPNELSKQVKVHLNKNGDEYAITAFNYSPDTRVILRAEIKNFKLEKAIITDVATRTLLKNADPMKGFLFEVKANDVAVIKISKTHSDYLQVVLQKTLAEKARKDREKYARMMQKANFKNVDRRIEWSVVASLRKKAIRMQGNGGYIFVDPENAIVNAWNPNTGEKLDGKGGIGDIVFSDKEQSMPVKYELESYSCANGVPVLEFIATIPDFKTESPVRNPLMGLNIRRVITLKTGKNLIVKTVFKNNSPFKKDMLLDLRFRNFLNTQNFSELQAEKTLPNIALAIVRKDFQVPAYAKHKLPWNACPVLCLAKNKNFTDKITFTFSKVMGAVYFWYSSQLRTIEPILKKTNLKYGESIEVKQQIEFERIYKK